jgi:vacuolar protein sorting-associated protein IST1
MPIFGGYDASKLKPQLKMAVTRFSIASNKKSALSKQQSREIAKMLDESPPREEKARIKAEALIRDDDTIEAYEILQLTCDLLFERIRLVSHSSSCPPDLVESVSTLMWASSVVDIPELVEIRKQFRHKYGRDFEEDAMRNAGGVVNARVASKLSVQPPSAYDVQVYLEKIADEHGVEWKPRVPMNAHEMYEPTRAPTGESVPTRGGSSGLIIPSAPPMSPSAYSVASHIGGGGTGGVPSYIGVTGPRSEYARVLPRPPHHHDNAQNVRMIADDIGEPDIFVPGASTSKSNKSPRGGGRDEDGDDDGGEGEGEGGEGDGGGGDRTGRVARDQSAGERTDGSGGGAGGGSDSFDDLAAKFASLQR